MVGYPSVLVAGFVAACAGGLAEVPLLVSR
jgi:hypothetical protein